MINDAIFKNEERAVYALRSLYTSFGYSPYKMSKFEEYDLYVRNKDFLISDGIITFTDTNGKLLALKPDVTLSIVKNSKESDSVQKVYYNENVYRLASGSHQYKEIMQTGLECIGNVSFYDVCEVVSLALRSLSLLDEGYILDIAHAGLVSALLSTVSDNDAVCAELAEALARKSEDAVDAMLSDGKIVSSAAMLLKALISEYSCGKDAFDAIMPFAVTEECRTALEELVAVTNTLDTLGYGAHISINFSLFDNTKYYSGVVFKGYIKGIPDSVLSGGRYDGLMKRMGKRASAIGFAVYLDAFERFGSQTREYDVDVLLLRDETAETAKVIQTVERLSAEGKKVLVETAVPAELRFRTLLKITAEGVVSINGND